MTEPRDKPPRQLADHPMFRRDASVDPGGQAAPLRQEEKRADDEHMPAEAAFARVIGRGADVYAVIDAARDSGGPLHARQCGASCESLFAGPLQEQVDDVAPYLVELRAHSSFWEWWYRQWGNSVGVLIQTPVSLAELRAHFRTLMVVRGEDRRKYFFRFYDPRVLRVFLPSCTPEEVHRFFGPVTAFHCEGPEGSELLTFKPGHNGVVVKQRPVETPTST